MTYGEWLESVDEACREKIKAMLGRYYSEEALAKLMSMEVTLAMREE